MIVLKQKDILKHLCWEAKYNEGYAGQMTPAALFLHGAAYDPAQAGVRMELKVGYDWVYEKPKQDDWRIADTVVQVTQPANLATFEAKRKAAAIHLESVVAGHQSARQAGEAKVDGRTKAGKRGPDRCQGNVALTLDPVLYEHEETLQAALIAECKAHGLTWSTNNKFKMGKTLKKHYTKHHLKQAQKKNARKSMDDYYKALITANVGNVGSPII